LRWSCGLRETGGAGDGGLAGEPAAGSLAVAVDPPVAVVVDVQEGFEDVGGVRVRVQGLAVGGYGLGALAPGRGEVGGQRAEDAAIA
jgi:hypothetical protein